MTEHDPRAAEVLALPLHSGLFAPLKDQPNRALAKAESQLDALSEAGLVIRADDPVSIATSTAIREAIFAAQVAWLACPGHDPLCPCQDGDPCNYRGENPEPPCVLPEGHTIIGGKKYRVVYELDAATNGTIWNRCLVPVEDDRGAP